MTSAVVTGIGVVAPNGLGTEAFWSATLRGQGGIRPIERFDPRPYPNQLAGEIREFDVQAHVPSRLIPQTDRMTQYTVAAADWAIADSGFGGAGESPLDLGVITASSAGGFEYGQRELQKLWSLGPRHVSAYMSFAWFYAVNSGQLAIQHNLRGPVGVFVTDQAGGLDAVAHARRKLSKGARMVLAGAVDSALCPYGMVAQITSRRLTGRTAADRAYLPFDRDADGHVPGEGGAILVLENGERARARGARIYGEIAGFAATFDPPPGTGRPANLRRAIENALADAGTAAADIAVVFADGAGVPELDRVEAGAIADVFGPRAVPVTVPKALIGRLASGAAPLDLVAAMLALRDGVIPPTPNVRAVPDTYGIDLVVDAPRPTTGRAALVVARGHAGFNSAMVVRSVHNRRRDVR